MENTRETDLLSNLDKLHSTMLGYERVRRNLGLILDDDEVREWCLRKIKSAENIVQRGKNWYVSFDNNILTINAHSYSIITARKNKIH